MSENLPKGWSLARLDSVCEFNPKHERGIARDALVSFVPMPAIDVTGQLLPHETRILADVWKGFTHFAENDVLFAKITPCMENGKIAVARGLHNGLGCGTTELHVLRSKGEVLPDYIQLFLRQEVFRQNAERAMTGAVGQRRVPAEYLKSALIPIPPIDEQHRILRKLGNLLERKKVSAMELNRATELVRRYKQSLLTAAFQGRLTKVWRTREKSEGTLRSADRLLDEIKKERVASTSNKRIKREFVFSASELADLHELPEGWRWVKLGELCTIITKGASPRWQGFNYVDDPTQVLFVTSENVRANYLDLSEPKFLELGFSEKQKNSVLQPGDILINIVGASIGRVATFELSTNANINQAVSLCRLVKIGMRRYISAFLNSDFAQRFYALNKVDVARANLSLEDISNIPIPLCSETEAAEVERELELRFECISRIANTIDQCLSWTESLEQACLRRAFEGLLVPSPDMQLENALVAADV